MLQSCMKQPYHQTSGLCKVLPREEFSPDVQPQGGIPAGLNCLSAAGGSSWPASLLYPLGMYQALIFPLT